MAGGGRALEPPVSVRDLGRGTKGSTRGEKGPGAQCLGAQEPPVLGSLREPAWPSMLQPAAVRPPRRCSWVLQGPGLLGQEVPTRETQEMGGGRGLSTGPSADHRGPWAWGGARP